MKCLFNAPQFWGFHYIYAYTFCCRTTKFDMVTHMARGLVFRGSTMAPSQKVGAPVLPSFWGSLSMTTLFEEERPYGHTYGEGLAFRQSATPSIPRQHGLMGPQFCVFSATYTHMIRLGTTKFCVITHMGRGVFLGGQPCHCICRNASYGLSVTAEFLI